MKVLHLGAGNLYGGIETILVTLARHRLLCPEMEPHFALCFEGRLSSELRETGVPVHMLGVVRASRPWTVIRARQELSRVLQYGFDAVVSHGPWVHALLAGAVNARHGIRAVFWAHNLLERTWLERIAAASSPSLVIANSQFTAESVPQVFPKVKAKVLHCPVPDTPSQRSRDEVRAELGIGQNEVVIIQVSRIEIGKGHAVLLDALARIRDEPNWRCVIVGGAQRPAEETYLLSMRRRCNVLGISHRVKFLGQRSDVSSLLRAADVFCQPNLTPDAFGIVFVEALWAGLPVIATSLGGAIEILEREYGVLVEPGDAAELATQLLALVRSPERRSRLRSGARQRASSLCDPARQLARLYTTLNEQAQA